MSRQTSDDIWNMQQAIKEAAKAYKKDEVPIGAVIVGPDGKVIAKAHNIKESNFNPCGHAEILAIQKATKKLENWRLADCTLVVTLEPCPMCLAAMVQARIKRCVFGAYDAKGGALSLGYRLHNDSRLNHKFEITGGVLHYETSRVLSSFFKEKRAKYRHSAKS